MDTRATPYRPPLLEYSGKVRLDLNESHHGGSPGVLAELSSINEESLRFYAKDKRLVGALAQFLRVDESTVTLAHGLSELLHMAVETFVTPNSAVVTLKPSWPYYKSLCDLKHARVVPVELSEGDGAFGSPKDLAFDWAEASPPSLIILTRPHMPTGFTFTYDDVKTVAGKFPDSVVLVDEAYWGFSEANWDGSENLGALIECCPNVLIGRTFSKLFSLASLRAAFSVSSPVLARRLSNRSPLFGLGEFAQRVAIAALADVQYYQELAREVAAVRNYTAEKIGLIPSLSPYVSDANFFMVKDELTDVPSLTKALSRAGFAVRDCAQYERPEFFRVSVATRPVMDEFIEQLHLCRAR